MRNGTPPASCCGRTSMSCACPCRRGRRVSGRATRSRSKRCWSCDRRCSASCSACRRVDVLERCRSAGIATLGAATTPAEAKLLADAGVDMIVATGFEAGGHRVSFLREPEDCLTEPCAGSAGGGYRESAGDRRRRHRRWPRHRRGAEVRRGRGADRHCVPGLRGIECLAAASREAVQRRCAAHHADARIHRTAGAQHSQRLHRCAARQGSDCSRRTLCKPGSRRSSSRGARPPIAPM